MDLFTLASSVGLSAPLTLLGIGLLHYAGRAPPFLELAVQRHPAMVSPLILLLAALLFLFEVLAAKSKLTKPFKALWDLSLVVVKPVATVVLGLAMLDVRFLAEPAVAVALRPPVLHASILSLPDLIPGSLTALGWLELTLAISVTLLVHLVRTGTDVLVWLSPFPFVDAIASSLADVYTVVMIAIALFLPRVAAVACALQLVACVLLAGFMARVAGVMLRLLAGGWGLAGNERRQPPGLVVRHIGSQDAVWCWVSRGGPCGRWATTWAWTSAGELNLAARSWWRWRKTTHDIGDGRHVAVMDGLLAREVSLRQGAIPIAVLRFPSDRSVAAKALVEALTRQGTRLDDATAGGTRLEARARAQVTV